MASQKAILQIRDPSLRLGAKGIEEIKQHAFFASVNFDTIWTIDPPTLQSGIVPAPPRRELDIEIVEPDCFSSAEAEAVEEWKPPQMSLHHHAGVESVDSSASSAGKAPSAQPSFEAAQSQAPISDPQAEKWWVFSSTRRT
jgi:hypothetical protein